MFLDASLNPHLFLCACSSLESRRRWCCPFKKQAMGGDWALSGLGVCRIPLSVRVGLEAEPGRCRIDCLDSERLFN
ncbi:UNVERIFIED_CONTAM: hypothetical protein FKN15_026378 [Acipenser sinensis]